jgi:hypothetical protein
MKRLTTDERLASLLDNRVSDTERADLYLHLVAADTDRLQAGLLATVLRTAEEEDRQPPAPTAADRR